jgi:hypothetical protein
VAPNEFRRPDGRHQSTTSTRLTELPSPSSRRA